MEEYFEFNLNTSILVKLTDSGYQHLADLNNKRVGKNPFCEYRTADYYKSQADKEGYTKFIGWGFIKDFGPVTKLLGPSYYSTSILIKESSLSKIEQPTPNQA